MLLSSNQVEPEPTSVLTPALSLGVLRQIPVSGDLA
jgi:hypothetical protein